MANITVAKIVKFLLICLVVGFFLSVFGLSPSDFWQWLIDLISYALDNAKAFLKWGLAYILAGAAIVVPIYVIILVRRYFSQKS